MNWITHLDTMATILVSADVASIFVSAVFFSERVRRWTSCERWGSHPAASALSYSIAVAGMDDSSIGSIRPQPVGTLRNPFDPRTREALANGTALRAHRDHSHRPTFRRSTVLQKRIANYERTLSAFLLSSSEVRTEARAAILPTAGGLRNPRFEHFSVGHFQEAQSI
jgi:hypothetical protein